MKKPVDILLVEDNPADIKLTSKMLTGFTVPYNLRIARDGVEAMELLLKENADYKLSLPDLILLDLNLPKKDGREVLKELKSDARLRRIPVIVLTTSSADTDILMSYELHANSYIKKPVDLDSFREVIKAIELFWLKIASLPPQLALGD